MSDIERMAILQRRLMLGRKHGEKDYGNEYIFASHDGMFTQKEAYEMQVTMRMAEMRNKTISDLQRPLDEPVQETEPKTPVYQYPTKNPCSSSVPYAPSEYKKNKDDDMSIVEQIIIGFFVMPPAVLGSLYGIYKLGEYLYGD